MFRSAVVAVAVDSTEFQRRTEQNMRCIINTKDCIINTATRLRRKVIVRRPERVKIR